ncbi:tandem-type lipoprotein [Staphylococcus aureus]|uniref:tandem-type lipoprotein n=1 Tax=Staphylococcus aureus TaxID=1280 RepID=UPI00139DA81B|nr:tandem-type lipoprotein [Staphylococcus aureus]NDP81710.1 tandem-type lipoprotein [Staphylococcus aureus]NDQ48978.1 tandem-type lipoprotein [Staphylococcus aureus]NDQ71902.1 tandem-type lipoprotein [Staphylococcus aureus]NDQ79090.1 tandem-type lipoprotein [Staphylococcus aureus]NDR41172.1 tandem-type lipoprotein [Staphylococcus aureus]
MRYLKRVVLYIIVMILSVFIIGCNKSSDTSEKPKEDSKEAQIKKSFAKTLDMYPTENLEDFYDKEGYRDGEFKKDDKGTWLIRSEIVKQPKDKVMKTRGMQLYINRNTKTAKGFFVLKEISEKNNHVNKDKEEKYEVKMVGNKIIPTEQINDEKIKKEIENFKFFVQYGNFKNFEKYKNGEFSYNPEAPIYSAKYQLHNDDYNVRQLRKRYDISTKEAPKLLLKGGGDLKDSSVGQNDIEFTFVERKGENIYFNDSVEFIPSK